MPEQKRETELKKADILIVGEDAVGLEPVGQILTQDYCVLSAHDGRQAFELLEEYSFRLILLDYSAPGGDRILSCLKENPEWSRIPVIVLTEDVTAETEKHIFAMGALDFIGKPYVPMTVKQRVERILELYGLRQEMESRLEEKTRMLERVSLNSIMAIASTIDAKDAYTSGHSMRVAKCASAIARQLGWDDEKVRNIQYIGLLHDIGKIGVPDSILNKPARLTAEEFSQIKRHPLLGAEILKDVRMIPGVADGARYHHERYDGGGYPYGLKGEEIPLCARIIALADTYDAMTSNRIYRARLPQKRVIAEFERCSGTQFDPQLCELFVGMLKQGFHLPQENRRRKEEAASGEKQRPERKLDREQERIAEENALLLNRVLSEYSRGKNETDSLTGLHNRSFGEARIDRLLAEERQGTFLLIDLDDFKHVNDLYGHLVGDRVLKVLASVLSGLSEERNEVCRLGGDEFVLFLPGTVEKENIKKIIGHVMEDFGQGLAGIGSREMTHLSVGVAQGPQDGSHFLQLYSNADKALYYVKKSGKNAYSFYREEQAQGTVRKPDTDLVHIRDLLEGRINRDTGAFKVPYEEFENLYAYLSRCVKRKGQQVQTLLFTLGDGEGYPQGGGNEDAMAALEVSVAYSLRMVDVGSRYSSLQYIVILVDTNLENGRMVAERVVNQFYKIYGGGQTQLSYDIQTMVVNGEA